MKLREIAEKFAAIHRTAWAKPDSLGKIVEVWRDNLWYCQ